MSLSDLASLGSFVSGLAVVISLIYLALQVRQAEKNQRAIIHQGRIAQSLDRLLRLAEPGIMKVYLKGLHGREASTEEVEFSQFYALMATSFREAGDLYFQHDLGLLDEGTLQNQLTPLRNALSTPGGKAFWRVNRDSVDPSLRERMDALDANLSVRSRPIRMFEYKTELAKLTTED